jgi:chromosome segregation protein
MRLERLEISGFKSFSDRSELSFDRGVTAIVGPNGCGKSNVADALTWVMGEQSAKSLRGDKMEDVIFSGSDARKPTGAAEVRLRFSDVPTAAITAGAGRTLPAPVANLAPQHELPHGEFHPPGVNGAAGNGNGHHAADLLDAVREVEVTRRLYRSGESEYLIDGHACRLRDIHELLMDTGLGAKAYAIIEQGKIGLILSSRPADRRQLIEEAAGITKYKARRRAAELKLEAAQQNLTRIDDIVFEIEKQRGSLKRQAAKARRYARLRDEMRRWEKVLFARRYATLGEAIAAARARLADTREQESVAAARLAAVEHELEGVRSDLAAAEAAAARVRDEAHGRELEINRRQQQIALDTQQAGMIQARSAELETERASLENRREPERLALDARRSAAVDADQARSEASAIATAASADHARAQQAIEPAEDEVDRARDGLYAVMNSATALTAALEAATVQRERASEALARLEVEAADLRTEHERAVAAQRTAQEAMALAQDTLETTRDVRAARQAELDAARAGHESRGRDLRSREHALAADAARLRSLEELDAHRAGFSDAARMVLIEANGQVGQLGAVVDLLDVEPRYERAVEAYLGDLLQHVLVRSHEHAAAGLALVRRADAGRCGFVVVEPAATGPDTFAGQTGASGPMPDGAVMLSSVVRVSGEHEAAVRTALGDAVIVATFEQARDTAAVRSLPVVTLEGDVLRGSHIVTGGAKAESRGILATKREIKELREQVIAQRRDIEQLAAETARFAEVIAEAVAALSALAADLHGQEKWIVSVEAQLHRAGDDQVRVAQRRALVNTETRRVGEEIAALEARQHEARESIARLAETRQVAEGVLADAQRRLLDARDQAHTLATRAAEARATHAALVERSAAAAADVRRMEDAARALEQRVAACASDLLAMGEHHERLRMTVAEGERQIEQDARQLDEVRSHLRDAEDRALALKNVSEQQEVTIRDARRALDAIRALAAELDVTRATAEADLTHLAQQCLDAVNLPLDEVRAEVEQMEAKGEVEPDIAAIRAAEAPEPDEEDLDADAGAGEIDAGAATAFAADQPVGRMTAEEAIAELRAKIDKLGPVNMMAIEQFAELDTRHTFLTTQRKDLVDSIAQTNEAIRRIDETTHARFREAFTQINANFQVTFSTLFGGGRAGIALLDDNDPLDSGIDIVASPPGKRLQSVQLLSGGEKALTAIALMFAIFRYKPSPFCLLDEIDAPLDDANIGRFVEMLRGMLDRTQFIIITHNRKTMEIADRLYGVTMEEPGVSKLISIQLN